MKQRKFLKHLPFEAKAFVTTILFGTLSLHGAKDDNVQKEQNVKNQAKVFPIGMPHFDLLYTYAMAAPSTNIALMSDKQNDDLFVNNYNIKDTLSEPKTDEAKAENKSISDTKNTKKNENIVFDERYGVKIVLGKKTVKYIYKDGTVEIRQGGTLPWRNKNPGAIRKSEMSVGTANKFAVFPSEEVGFEALRALLRGENYRNLTLKSAIFKYAPPHENDTRKYQSDIKRLTGVDLNRKLCDLNAEEFERVVKTIKQLEGWVPGKLTRIEAPTVTDTLAKAIQYTR